MPSSFRALTTPAFERDVRSLTRRDTRILRLLEKTLGVLEEDPFNRSRMHDIKKLAGLNPAKGIEWATRRGHPFHNVCYQF